MSGFWIDLLWYLGIAIVSYYILSITKKYILKTKIKKWHVLVIIIVLLFLPLVTYPFIGKYKWVQYIEVFIIYYFMFLYIEFMRIDRIKKNAPVVGRPKPNARRAKSKK